jgi:hypothetical protein
MRTSLTVAALAVSLCACSASTSSRNIRTGGIVALIDVSSETAGSSEVDTELVIGGTGSNTNVILEGGDAISAEAGGQKQALTVEGKGEYGGRFATSDGEFVVSLARDVDAPAPNNRGTMGPAFEIHVPNAPVSRGAALALHWSPVDPESEVEIELDGDCLIHERRTIGGDTGSVTFAPGELRAWKKKVKETCVVEAVVTRTRKGTTDPALDKDSRFLLHQVRRARFSSAP